MAAVVDHYRQGDYEAALAEAKLLQMPRFFASYMLLAMCYGQLGREREGHAACDKLLELVPDIGAYVREFLTAWNMPEDLIDNIVDGLRKAGLRVPDQTG